MNALLLVLTSECNLRCSYCFQSDKKDTRMEWDIMRRAIDLALEGSQSRIQIIFSGGEPLLEFPLIERGVAYAKKRCPSGKQSCFSLITNGTLFRDPIVDFLAEHHFEVQVSLDGIPRANDLRGQGTFSVLDKKLARIRDRHPRFFSTIAIGAIVSPETVKHMGDSAAYFFSGGYNDVTFSPLFTDSSAWNDHGLKALDEQFSRICRLSLDHYRETATVPISNFGLEERQPSSHDGKPLRMCGASSAACPAVDVNGRIHACATFVDTYQKLPSEFMRTRLDAIRLGDVRTGDFWERMKGFEVSAEGIGLLHNKQDKYSSYGRCGECAYLHSCAICPTSIGHIPGNTDPNRIPDFVCAFTLASNRYAEKFIQDSRALEASEPGRALRARSRIHAFAKNVRAKSETR